MYMDMYVTHYIRPHTYTVWSYKFVDITFKPLKISLQIANRFMKHKIS